MATEHFTNAELCCPCGCERKPTPLFQRLLEELRLDFAKPMPVSSGMRCAEYDEEIGGSGAHPLGAVDVNVHGAEAFWLVYHAQRRGWTGIGLMQHGPIAKRFVHLDRRAHAGETLSPWVWTYEQGE